MSIACVDAFSGAGGMALGLQKAGFDVRISFDNDPLCIATQKLNPKWFSHDHEAILASIQEMLGGRLLKLLKMKRGQLPLLAGGPPCQGFSIQRIGSDQDVRNDLVLYYARLIDEVRPKMFIVENVPGIIGKRGRAVLEEFTKQIYPLGYCIQQRALDASHFGVPQRRKRVFIIGERLNLPGDDFIFPKPLERSPKTVRQTIGKLPVPPDDGFDHPRVLNHRRDRLSDLNLTRLRNLKEGQGREHLPVHLLADCHKRGASEIGHRNVYGRMVWDAVAPTITARFDSFTRGQFGHPDQDRSISLREGALLQTFPLDYNFVGNKVDIARQIGNAVPPLLAERLGTCVLKRLLQAQT